MGRSRASSLPALRSANSEPTGRTLYGVIWLLHAVVRRVTDRAWSGQEKVPATGGIVVVANHISNFDPIAVGQYLAFAGRWPHFLGKASLFRLPLVGRIIRAAEQIPVERASRAGAGTALTAAVTAVRQGQAVVIYPEGTITLDPALWPMAGKTGAARVALETGCPVVPLGQWGAQQVMYGKQVSWPRFQPRPTLAVTAGDPVDLDDLRGQPITAQVLRTATDRIMDTLTSLVADLRGETPPARRLDPRSQPGEERGQ